VKLDQDARGGQQGQHVISRIAETPEGQAPRERRGRDRRHLHARKIETPGFHHASLRTQGATLAMNAKKPSP